MGAAIAFPGFLLTLASFVLLLLNTLSVPIIQTLYFLSIYVNESASSSLSSDDVASVSGSLHLGTFGYCSTGIDATVSTTSVLRRATGTTTTGTTEVLVASGCTSARLGYQLDSSLFTTLESVAGISLEGLDSSAVKDLTYVMVLQPIAAGFAGISLLFAFSAWCGRSRFFEVFAFLWTLLSALIAWVAWGVALALFLVAKARVYSASSGVLEGKLGVCIWLGLVAAILLSIAICFTCAGIFGPYSRSRRAERRANDTYDAGGVGVVGQQPMMMSSDAPAVAGYGGGAVAGQRTTAWQRWRAQRDAGKGTATY